MLFVETRLNVEFKIKLRYRIPQANTISQNKYFLCDTNIVMNNGT